MRFLRYSLLAAVAAAMLVLPQSCGNKVVKVKGDSVIVRLATQADGGPSQIRLQVLGEKIMKERNANRRV